MRKLTIAKYETPTMSNSHKAGPRAERNDPLAPTKSPTRQRLLVADPAIAGPSFRLAVCFDVNDPELVTNAEGRFKLDLVRGVLSFKGGYRLRNGAEPYQELCALNLIT